MPGWYRSYAFGGGRPGTTDGRSRETDGWPCSRLRECSCERALQRLRSARSVSRRTGRSLPRARTPVRGRVTVAAPSTTSRARAERTEGATRLGRNEASSPWRPHRAPVRPSPRSVGVTREAARFELVLSERRRKRRAGYRARLQKLGGVYSTAGLNGAKTPSGFARWTHVWSPVCSVSGTCCQPSASGTFTFR